MELIGGIGISIGADVSGAIKGIEKMSKSMLAAGKMATVQETKIGSAYSRISENVSLVASAATAASTTINDVLGGLDIQLDMDGPIGEVQRFAQITGGVTDSAVLGFDNFKAVSTQVGESIRSIGAAVPKVGGAITALAGPVAIGLGAIVAAGAAIIANFNEVSEATRRATNLVRGWYNEYKPIRIAVEGIALAAKTIIDVGTAIIQTFAAVGSTISGIVSDILAGNFSSIGDRIAAGMLQAQQAARDAAASIKANFEQADYNILVNPTLSEISEQDWEANVAGPVRDYAAKWGIKLGNIEADDVDIEADGSSMVDSAARAARQAEQAAIAAIKPIPLSIDTAGVTTTADSILGNVQAEIESISKSFSLLSDPIGETRTQIRAVEDALQSMGENGVQANSSAALELQAIYGQLEAQQAALKKTTDATANSFQNQAQVIIDFAPLLTDTLGNFATDLGSAVAAGGSVIGSLFGGITKPLGAFLDQLGTAALQAGIGVEAVRASVATFSGAGAIASGIALKAIAAIFTSKATAALPALATGGLAYGETAAIVGDNPNARIDPEVIAPLSKLKAIIGDTGSSPAAEMAILSNSVAIKAMSSLLSQRDTTPVIELPQSPTPVIELPTTETTEAPQRETGLLQSIAAMISAITTALPGPSDQQPSGPGRGAEQAAQVINLPRSAAAAPQAPLSPALAAVESIATYMTTATDTATSIILQSIKKILPASTSAAMPALASGGLAYGITQAIVGDNPNARIDPEVIAPLSQLKGMINNTQQGGRLYGKLSGRDILLSNQRTSYEQSWTG